MFGCTDGDTYEGECTDAECGCRGPIARPPARTLTPTGRARLEALVARYKTSPVDRLDELAAQVKVLDRELDAVLAIVAERSPDLLDEIMRRVVLS